MTALVLFSLIVALLRGGRLKQEVPGIAFPLLGFLVQFPLSHLFPGSWIATVATVAGYLLTLPFFWHNRKSLGLTLLLAGLALNFAVIAANGGKMPVDEAKAVQLGLPPFEGPAAKHQPLTEHTRLPFLADIIPIRPVVGQVYSVGDLFLMVGAFLFVQELLGLPLWRRPNPNLT